MISGLDTTFRMESRYGIFYVIKKLIFLIKFIFGIVDKLNKASNIHKMCCLANRSVPLLFKPI